MEGEFEDLCSSTEPSFQAKVKGYIDAISKDTTVVLSMIEKLGHFLTSENAEQRQKGVEFVTQVVEGLPEKTLSHECVTPLLSFYAGRANEVPSLVPILVRGIHALLVRHGDPDAAAVDRAWRCLLQHLEEATLLQGERYLAYRALAHLVVHRTDVLPGFEFVEGYVRAVDGERDPRCLMQVFATVPLLCRTFILGDLAEQLFDVCACYFPVDFRPPPDAAISREDLALALQRCLVASPAFGSRCVELAVEKLTSDLLSARLDALHLLEEGTSVFHPACFQDHLITIWKEIHRAVFVERKETLVPAALSTLTKVAGAVSSDPDQVKRLLKAVWKDVQRGEAPGATEALEAFARGSDEACSALLVHCAPHLLKLLTEAEGRRATAMECVTRLLSVRASAAKRPPEPALQLLTDQLCGMLNDPDRSLADESAAALASVLDVQSLFDEAQLRRLRDSLLAVREEPRDTSDRWPELLSKVVALDLPLAEETSRVLLQDVTKEYDPVKTPKVLKLVAACASSRACFSATLDALSDGLLDALTREDDVDHANLLALSLLDATKRALREGLDVSREGLLRKLVDVRLRTVPRGNVDRLPGVEKLLETLIRDCDLSVVAGLLSRVADECSREDAHAGARSLLGCLVRNAPAELLSSRLAPILLRGEDFPAVGALVNKVREDLSETLRRVREELRDPRTTSEADLLLWTTKGLLLRGYPNLDFYLDELVGCLGESGPVGRHVALGFDLLLRPSDLVIEGHCTVTPTHAQRLFVGTAPRLVCGFESSGAAVRDNFLTALCCQLKYLPRAVVDSYIDQVLPVLVSALDGAGDDVLSACILPRLREHAALAASRIEEVVDRLLHLTALPHTLEVRRIALECLEKMATVEEPNLLQHRRRVLRGLAPGLADHKRLVRCAAAAAHSAWAMVGQPR